MSTTQLYRKQIASVKSIQTITHAMELVAASRIRKVQKRMEESRPYAYKIREVLGHLASSQHHCNRRALMQLEQPKKVAMIVVSSDSGLCGGLNLNLFKSVVNQQKEWSEQSILTEMCLLGRKAMSFFKRFDTNILAYAEKFGTFPKVAELIGVVKIVLDAFDDQKIDAIYLCYNKFVNTMLQAPQIVQLLPLEKIAPLGQREHWDYLYEADFDFILDTLLTRYIESQVYQSVIENIACEQAARMLAMKNATDNTADLIQSLQLAYNKVRQAGITQEISEIVAGVEAL